MSLCSLRYLEVWLEMYLTKCTLTTRSILLIQSNIRGGISATMGNIYVISDENGKFLYVDATNLYGYSLMEYLPHGLFKFDNDDFELDKNLNTSGDNEIGNFIEVDFKNPKQIRRF